MAKKEKNAQLVDEEIIEEVAEEEKVEETAEEEKVEEAAEEEKVEEDKKMMIINSLIIFGFPALLFLAFLLTGIIASAWGISWLFLLVIPIYWSGLVAFYKKNPYLFLFPLLALGIYLFIGLSVKDNKGWNPYWLILLEIPLYYLACWLIKSILSQNDELEEAEDEIKEEVQEEVEDEIKEEVQEQVKEETQEEVKEEHKDKKNVSHRREKLAKAPKKKKVKVVTEGKNYNKEKKKVKIKADITEHKDEAEINE